MIIDELSVYGQRKSIFKGLAEASPTLQGRYHVSPNYGYDLNTNNLQKFIKDPLYGLSAVNQKYPICVCMTPKSRPTRINGMRWEKIFFSLYFLRKSFITGDNQIDTPDDFVNTQSQLLIEQDWSEMKNVAVTFLFGLEDHLDGSTTEIIVGKSILYKGVLNIEDKSDIIRLSRFNNDDLTGVQLNVIMNLNLIDCL